MMQRRNLSRLLEFSAMWRKRLESSESLVIRKDSNSRILPLSGRDKVPHNYRQKAKFKILSERRRDQLMENQA